MCLAVGVWAHGTRKPFGTYRVWESSHEPLDEEYGGESHVTNQVVDEDYGYYAAW
jgi:hypothetical protein